jgi:hypothetical protein
MVDGGKRKEKREKRKDWSLTLTPFGFKECWTKKVKNERRTYLNLIYRESSRVTQ